MRMKYITHNRFKGLAACGQQLNLPYGTELETAGDFLITGDGRPVCYGTSETAKRHFARNDDGQGLARGALTWAIAYRERRRRCGDGAVFRFSEGEQALLVREWGHFLRTDVETILFNEDFFAAEVPELQRLADALHITPRR